MPSPTFSRRSLLRGGAAWLGAAAFSGAAQSLLARQALAGRARLAAVHPYGDPVEAIDQSTGLPLLRLPPGFTYRSFGWAGDPMLGGQATPGNHDGMAVVQVLDNRTRDLVLIRNHELLFGNATIGAGAVPTYDSTLVSGFALGGGTTSLTFRRGQWVDSRPTLGGTVINCAGGPTPWGSWLSCEEVIADGRGVGGLIHGWVFEVPAPSLGSASAVPIRDMGLFKHEAVAIDPLTGFAYETEDNSPNSGFYRYRPNQPNGGLGSLEAGGALEMLKVVDAAGADLRAPSAGQTFEVEWVPIPDPQRLPDGAVGLLLYFGPSEPYLQGSDAGGARFARLEGCTFADGAVWFCDTAGGAAGRGVLWRYDTPAALGRGDDRGRLTAFFVSTGRPDADSIDNLTVSPRGGLLLCEDHLDASVGTRLMGITPDGVAYPFAVNQVELAATPPGKAVPPGNYRGSEWAGCCFDPSGRWLFANIYNPGITFAISGPWAEGPL